MDDVRRRVLVSGRVQGVYFRDSCRQMAQRLGVRGWVRNRTDGRVELAAEGSPDDVDQLISWCRRGPRHATVVSIELFDEPVVGETSFRITR